MTNGEDATLVVCHVEFDTQTSRCDGFVLPLNQVGLPEVDSFVALAFERIETVC